MLAVSDINCYYNNLAYLHIFKIKYKFDKAFDNLILVHIKFILRQIKIRPNAKVMHIFLKTVPENRIINYLIQLIYNYVRF